MESNKIVVFQSKQVRRVWHEEQWYFSVVDVCGALTDSPDGGAYWRKLKQRLKQEGGEVVTFCHGLKLEAQDGKKYTTDCANMRDYWVKMKIHVQSDDGNEPTTIYSPLKLLAPDGKMRETDCANMQDLNKDN